MTGVFKKFISGLPEKAGFFAGKIRKRFGPIAARLGAALAGTLDDILLVIGCGLISYGAALIYRPAGFIALGVSCIAWAVIWSRGTGGDGGEEE